MPKSPIPVEKLTYEQAFKELETIVTQLENDSPALEETTTLFERGQALIKRCATLLDQAELKVKQLTSEEIATPNEEEEE